MRRWESRLAWPARDLLSGPGSSCDVGQTGVKARPGKTEKGGTGREEAPTRHPGPSRAAELRDRSVAINNQVSREAGRGSRCQHAEAFELSGCELWQCKACGYQKSATAGTVLHRTRMPLPLWFWAAYLTDGWPAYAPPPRARPPASPTHPGGPEASREIPAPGSPRLRQPEDLAPGRCKLSWDWRPFTALPRTTGCIVGVSPISMS